MRIGTYFVLLFFVSISCKKNNQKSLQLGEYKVVGDISSDTAFNGPIKYYDSVGKLRFERNYEFDVLDGKSIDYYENGNISSIQYYKDGKIHGTSKLFNSQGGLELQNFFYYNLRCGPSLYFKDGNISEYYFYSLDGRELFHINYDSIYGRKITDIQSGFFFYNLSDIRTNVKGKVVPATHCRLYLNKPPKYNFRYELVIIDSQFRVIESLNPIFDINEEPWAEFTLLPFSDTIQNRYYGISLKIYDSTNNLENTMIKALPTLF